MIITGRKMDWQTLINIGAGVVIAMMGWFARELWDIVKQIKDDLKKIEVKIAEDYVKKVDLNSRLDKIDDVLQRIFDRLDNKVDK